MSNWIEVQDVINNTIGRTYQEGLDVGSAVLAKRREGMVDLSFLNVKWITVDFMAGFQNSLNNTFENIRFHYMVEAVRTILGAKYVHSNANTRRTVSSQGSSPRNSGQNMGRGSRKIDFSGG